MSLLREAWLSSALPTWFEAPGAIHTFAENASATEPEELLAIFVAAIACGPLTIPVPD